MTSTSPAGESLVRLDSHGRVLLITMQRDDKRNAMNRPLADALDAALSQLDDDPAIWAGVLTGGIRAFSAGSDLTARGDYVTERGGEYGIIRRTRAKPLIAAVEGPAFGGGLEIVLCCDLVVAATTASFALPEVKRGLVPTCGALFRALDALPVNLARELILTGRPLSPERAHAVGFVNALAEPGSAATTALALAEEICTNGPVAVQACTQAMNGILASADDAGWEATAAAQRSITTSADMREGIAAFLERRPPRWLGR
jgi:enoyl-CoA hydratase/carnithine racemase